MRILHINVSDRQGGASIATWRLHQGLRKSNIDSHILVHRKTSADDSVQPIMVKDHLEETHQEIINRIYYYNRSDISNTHFSLPLNGIDLTTHPLATKADILHLHWVASFQTPKSVQQLLGTKKPIVWTLHDLAPFTGGCHFTAGCERYQSDCSNCPQYLSDPFDISRLVLQEKKRLWAGYPFTIIAPSEWIAKCARSSAVFGTASGIHVIPNAIDNEIFKPLPQEKARETLNLLKNKQYLLCGSDQSNEKRKGFAVLSRILKACFQSNLLKNTQILWVGDAPPGNLFDNLPLIPLGRIHSEAAMAEVYAAADAFILSSLEDNLPNMALEALSCGTPVIAFDVGGVKEIVQHERHGYLSMPGDDQAMIANIITLLSSRDKRRFLSNNCRSHATENFDEKIIAKRHLELYENVLLNTKNKNHRINNFVTDNSADQLNQLLPALTIHCLTEEIKNKNQYIHELQADHQARLEVINEQQSYIQYLREKNL